jgi:hypothetical protein
MFAKSSILRLLWFNYSYIQHQKGIYDKRRKEQLGSAFVKAFFALHEIFEISIGFEQKISN